MDHIFLHGLPRKTFRLLPPNSYLCRLPLSTLAVLHVQ